MSAVQELAPPAPGGAQRAPAGSGNHPAGRVRSCEATGLPVCLDSELFVRLHAVVAVVFLLVGGIAALLLVLTRWPAVHLLSPVWYYRTLTLHGVSMLILWILFFEVAILYFVATSLLNARLFSRKVAWAGWGLMVAGGVMVDGIILAGKADVLLTSYAPLEAHPCFYLGIILVAVGTLTALFNYFATLYTAKRDRTYQGAMPLVAFGATAAAIIAVVTLLHGAAVMVPSFLWSIGLMPPFDPAAYRLVWWGLGHMSQQVNVCAMVSVWYFLGSMTVGARPVNQAVCRGAFLLYILFINLASAHHLLVDPGVSAGWKIWNTSYAMYLAVLASMIHGFTVPASVESAMRGKGHDRGIFGWLSAAPWRNPGFSAFFLSLVIFGFLGGITGVTLGTQQINIIAHNTLRITGHFHATVVGGTTLAFMGLTYYVVPLVFRREFAARGLARVQPYLFAAGITMLSVGMSFAGSYGVPRRHWDAEMAGAPFAQGLDAAAHVWLGVVGIGGTLAWVALMAFIGLVVHAVFLGERVPAGRSPSSWTASAEAPSTIAQELAPPASYSERMPGTIVLALAFLASFAVYYFANWKALAGVWQVR